MREETVPSLQSLSGPHQAEPPDQLAGHRPPEPCGTAWGLGLDQIARFPEECSSGSMPAGARRPRNPGQRRSTSGFAQGLTKLPFPVIPAPLKHFKNFMLYKWTILYHSFSLAIS